MAYDNSKAVKVTALQQRNKITKTKASSIGLARTVYIYIYTYIHTVYLVISKLKIPYVHRIYMVLANPIHVWPPCCSRSAHTEAGEARKRRSEQHCTNSKPELHVRLLDAGATAALPEPVRHADAIFVR